MYGVDLYGRVRLAVLGQGISQREAARRFGIDRGTPHRCAPRPPDPPRPYPGNERQVLPPRAKPLKTKTLILEKDDL